METKVEKTQLLVAAKSLNESGLASFKVKVVAVSNEEMYKQFLNAVETIAPENEEKIPDIVGDVFNSLRDEEDAGTLILEGRTGTTEEANTAGNSESTGTASKTEVKEKKKSNLPEKEKNKYGHVKGSMADTIEILLDKGATKAEIVKELMEKHGRDEAHAVSKFKAHLKYLKVEMLLNITLDETTMVYKIVPKEENK
jgi:hypothetical protein